MMCFSRYLGLLVGDKIEDDNPTWQLYILFGKIVAIVTSPQVDERHIIQLELIATEFLSLYKDLYGNLKFKFHNMTHLMHALRKYGPLVYTWCMRFEAKHRQLKSTATSISGSLNLPKSIFVKCQLRLVYLRVNKSYISEDLVFGSYETVTTIDRRRYFPYVEDSQTIYSIKNVHFHRVEYYIGMVFVTEIRGDCIYFGQIDNIFIKAQNVFR